MAGPLFVHPVLSLICPTARMNRMTAWGGSLAQMRPQGRGWGQTLLGDPQRPAVEIPEGEPLLSPDFCRRIDLARQDLLRGVRRDLARWPNCGGDIH